MMRTTIEMAREASGDDWGLFQEYMPEIHRLVELVRADERARMAEQPAQRKPLTDKEIDAVMPQPAEFGIVQPPWNGLDITILRAMARATEAAHNIKE